MEDVLTSGSVLTRVSGALCPSAGALTGAFELAPAQTLSAGTFSVLPAALDFGSVRASETSRRSVTLRNETSANVTIERAAIVGSNAYSTASGGFIVRALTQSPLTISFTPPETGTFRAELKLHNQAGQVISTTPLSGRGE